MLHILFNQLWVVSSGFSLCAVLARVEANQEDMDNVDVARALSAKKNSKTERQDSPLHAT